MINLDARLNPDGRKFVAKYYHVRECFQLKYKITRLVTKLTKETDKDIFDKDVSACVGC